MRRLVLVPAVLVLAAAAAGCGSRGNPPAAPSPTAQPPTATTATTATPTTTAAGSAGSAGPGALQAEATAAAAGDIPDNQTFLGFRNGSAGYSIKYPEGWAQQGSGKSVVFRDKNNIVRVVVAPGGRPTAREVGAELGRLKGVTASERPKSITLSGAPALKVVYRTESAPNPVTGKRVVLLVDRYYLWRAGRRAVVDLGTPQGVDNVDAYRLMIESFRWR
jgi:hypothetical protein